MMIKEVKTLHNLKGKEGELVHFLNDYWEYREDDMYCECGQELSEYGWNNVSHIVKPILQTKDKELETLQDMIHTKNLLIHDLEQQIDCYEITVKELKRQLTKQEGK